MSSLEQLYDEHADALHGFLLNVTRHEEDTRDLIQAVFTKIARQPECLKAARRPRAFLLQMAYRLFVDMARQRETRARYHAKFHEEVTQVLEPDFGAEDLRRQLEAGLAALPEEQRAVVHLRIWEDLTFAEIGRLLGITKGTAVSRFRYALEKLHAHLSPDFPHQPAPMWTPGICPSHD